MNVTALWNKFLESGSVYDYISYKRCISEVKNESEHKNKGLGSESNQLERER